MSVHHLTDEQRVMVLCALGRQSRDSRTPRPEAARINALAHHIISEATSDPKTSVHQCEACGGDPSHPPCPCTRSGEHVTA